MANSPSSYEFLTGLTISGFKFNLTTIGCLHDAKTMIVLLGTACQSHHFCSFFSSLVELMEPSDTMKDSSLGRNFWVSDNIVSLSTVTKSVQCLQQYGFASCSDRKPRVFGGFLDSP